MILGWVLIQCDWCPYERRGGHRYRGTTTGGHGEITRYKPRREAVGETNLVNTLISDFQPPEL